MSKMTSLRKSLRRVLGATVVVTLLAVGFVTPAKAATFSNPTITVHYNKSDFYFDPNTTLHAWATGGTISNGSTQNGQSPEFKLDKDGVDSYGGVMKVNMSGASVSQFCFLVWNWQWSGGKDAGSSGDRCYNLTKQNDEIWIRNYDNFVGSSDPFTTTPNPLRSPAQTVVVHYDGNTTTYPKLYLATRSDLNTGGTAYSYWVAPQNISWSSPATFTGANATATPAASTDNFGATLTVRLPYDASHATWAYMTVNDGGTGCSGGWCKDGGNASGNRYAALDASGTTNIWLITGDTNSNATFTSNPYGSTPTITSVTDTTVGSGSTGKSGDTISIVGTNLLPTVATPAKTSTPTITVGGTAATSISCSSSTTCTATVPSGSVGAANVVVSNAAGTVTSTGGFTYASAPTVTSLSSITPVRGQSITVTGTNLTGATFTVGGVAATVTTASATAPVITVPTSAPIAAGSVVATTNGGSASTSVTVTKGTPTLTSPLATAIDAGSRLSSSTLSGGTATINGVTVAGTFAWTSPSAVPTAGTGNYSVTFTPTDSTGFNSATTTASVEAGKTSPTITATPAAGAITYGQTLASSSLTGGSATVAGTFAFATPTAAPVVGTANQSVIFTPTDTASYNTVVFNVSVTVNKATPTISATPNAAAITYGAVLSTATLSSGSASVAGAFAYATPGATPGAGTASKSVTFTPTDTSNYNTVTGISVSVTVNKATPTLVAPTATGLVTGQSLSSSTLSGGSATSSASSVAGSFAWTSSATVPSIGTTSYGVTFTPTDTANYNTNTTDVSVTTYGIPTISSVTPTSGASSTSVTITGTYLSNATVTIGGAAAAIATNTATSISVTVPVAATLGAGSVSVTTNGGTVSSAFNVLQAPAITSLSSSSVTRGGTLTINGTGLSGATVTIGGTSATISSNTATAIAVTVPSSLSFGSQSVVVTTEGGSATNSGFSVAGYSSATLIIHYNKQDFTNLNTYLHSWVQTGTGSASGSSVVGTYSTQSPETSVDSLGYDSYGAVAKITYTGSNIQQVGFLVWTLSGTFNKDAGSSADRYRTLTSASDEIWIRNYDSTVSNSDPFSSINPNPNRPTTQSVTIHYDGNTTTYPKVYLATRSDLNDTAVSPYTYWVGANYLDFTTPVTITGASGSSTSTVGTDTFGKYVTYTFPYNANHTTWANMIVGNSNLSAKDAGQVGTGNRYAALDASGTTSIWLVSGDTSSNSGNAAYTSNPYATPVVSSLSATSGKAGDSLTITGTGLKPQAGSNPSVTIGGVNAAVTSATATSVVVTIPAGLTNNVASAVVVSNAGGTSNSDKTFTIVAVPTISSLNVTSGVRGDVVTITGTGFTGASSVVFGSTSASSYSVISATSITATVPTGVANGLQNVAVTTLGGTATSTGAFTVNKATPSVTATPTPAAITYGQTLASATLSGGSASVAGSFAYATPTATPTAGTADKSVVFTPSNTTSYNTVTFSVSVTVNKANPTVATGPSASGITYGQTLADSNLTGGSVSVAGSWAWSDSTIEPSPGSANQTAVFTPTDGDNYNTVERSVSVTTSKATPSIIDSPSAENITYGQTLASATLSGGSASVDGSFAFATPTAAPVAGTASKSVVFTPSDTSNYNTVSLSVSVTTNKATPDVTWPTASGIRNPAPLSSSTLSGGSASFGSTSVAGSFAWVSPTTVPASGTADYSVQFTPSSSNFSTVTGDVSVTSLPAFAGAPTVGVAAQSGGTVSAEITPASGTTLGSVTVTVDGAVRTYSVSDDTYSVTVTRADAGKAVVFSAIGTEEGKLDSDSTSNSPLTVGVATAPTIGTVSQSGLTVSADITAASGTDLTGVAVTVAGTAREFEISDETYTVTLTRADLGSSVIFSAAASATAGNKLDSAASTSSAFTFSSAAAPTSVDASQSGFDVTATVQLAANTSVGNVIATVQGASPVALSAEADGSFVVTLTRADAGKTVTFTATATQDGKAESDSTSSSSLTFKVATTPTFGTVSQDGLTLSVDVNSGDNQSVGTVSATVDGNAVSVANTTGDTYEVDLSRSAIGKPVVFTATATRTGFAESAPASTSGYTVLVAAAPTFGATTQNELVISTKVNLGGDQTYGTVTASVDGGEAQETTYEGDGVFSITLTKDEIGKSIVFSAVASQSGRADSDAAQTSAYTMLTPAPQLASLSVDYGIRGASITANGNYLAGGSIKVGNVSANVTATTYTSITFTVPASVASGEVSVVATTNNGTSSGLTFTVADAPTITGFAAWMGSSAPYVTNRGRTFDIFGTNLNNASFTVGGVPVSTVKGGDTVVRVMLPADAAMGTGQAVVATTPMGGPSNIMYVDVIEHLPVITGFGATAVRPGDLLTIYGNWLDNPAKVRFSVGGLVSATVGVDAALTGPDVVLTSTAITVRVPASAQSGRIRIYTPVGFIQSTDILTIYPAPKITTMKIGSVFVTGAARGKVISLAGLGFTNASVTIGGVSAQVASSPTPKDTGFNVIVPNGVTPGASTQLIVTSQYGVPSAPLAFTVGYDQPVINSLSVTGGALGSLVTINGKDLTGTSSVKFAVNKLANLSDAATVITDTAVTVKVPAGATTGVITLTARGGTVTSTSFTVYQAPTLSAPAPTVGKAGAIISIAGTNLSDATFRIGGVVASPAPSFTATAVSARIVVPVGAALSTAVGDSTVSVTTLGGTASAPFTVVGAPAISGLSSSSAVVGTDITISGSRLLNPTASPAAAAISVKIGGVAATVKTGATSSQLVVTVPLTAPVGGTTLSVTTLGGTVSTGLTVLPLAPIVSGLNVATQNRGLTVRISGSNLLNATVTIGGVSATVAGGATAAALVVTVPENAPLGSQTVLVTTAGGSDSTKLLVVKVQLPRVTAVSQVGTKRGVGTVTITGSFLTDATVKVGTVTASVVNINEAGTSLTFTIPATAVAFSQAVITITTPGGSWASASTAQKIAVTA